jgi:hypothetical protein
LACKEGKFACSCGEFDGLIDFLVYQDYWWDANILLFTTAWCDFNLAVASTIFFLCSSCGCRVTEAKRPITTSLTSTRWVNSRQSHSWPVQPIKRPIDRFFKPIDTYSTIYGCLVAKFAAVFLNNVVLHTE